MYVFLLSESLHQYFPLLLLTASPSNYVLSSYALCLSPPLSWTFFFSVLALVYTRVIGAGSTGFLMCMYILSSEPSSPARKVWPKRWSPPAGLTAEALPRVWHQEKIFEVFTKHLQEWSLNQWGFFVWTTSTPNQFSSTCLLFLIFSMGNLLLWPQGSRWSPLQPSPQRLQQLLCHWAWELNYLKDRKGVRQTNDRLALNLQLRANTRVG